MTCPHCGMMNEREARDCANCGTALGGTRSAWIEAGGRRARGKPRLRRFAIPILFVMALAAACAHAFNTMLMARERGRRNECAIALQQVQAGLIAYRSRHGSLMHVDPHADAVCHLIIPGAHTPRDCAGMVAARVDRVCAPGTFRVDVNEDKEFAVTAHDRTRYACDIYLDDDSTDKDIDRLDLRRCRMRYEYLQKKGGA